MKVISYDRIMFVLLHFLCDKNRRSSVETKRLIHTALGSERTENEQSQTLRPNQVWSNQMNLLTVSIANLKQHKFNGSRCLVGHRQRANVKRFKLSSTMSTIKWVMSLRLTFVSKKKCSFLFWFISFLEWFSEISKQT